MLLDLNKFFSHENGVNLNESTSTQKTRRKEEGTDLENDQSMSPLIRDRPDGQHHQLKTIDDNPLDIQNRRLYFESDKQEDAHNNINKEEFSKKNNNKDVYNFPVVNLEAVDWDYEGIEEPLKWSEIMIREAIGKENQSKINPKRYQTTSTTVATTVAASTTIKKSNPTTSYPLYNFDLMKVNHEDSTDDLSEELPPSKDLWGEIHQKFGESTTAPETPATTSHKILTIRGRREKRRRRKVKKNLWIPTKSELSASIQKEEDDNKIFNPLEDDWKSIFRSTTMMPVIDFSVSDTTTAFRAEPTERTETRRKQRVDKNTGFLKRLVSKYCNIENTLGILQLCNSKSLSKRRKVRKNYSVIQNNKPQHLNQNKERKQQDFNFLNTVSNVFSLILPSR